MSVVIGVSYKQEIDQPFLVIMVIQHINPEHDYTAVFNRFITRSNEIHSE